MTNEEKAKKLEDIAKLEEQLSTLELPALLRLQKYNILKLLKFDFIKDQNSKEQCKELDDMANKIIDESYRLIRGASIAEQGELYKLIKSNYQFLGRRHLKEFMISIEWDFKPDMKFYDIRQIVFDEWIQQLEDLEYGILNGLSISAPPRSGKALSMDSKILTPNGWVENRHIKPGDYAIGSNGKPVEILEIFPQGVTDMYEITFDDKTKVKCSGDHLWTVRTNSDRQLYKGKRRSRVLQTRDMIDDYILKRKNDDKINYKYSIDFVQPVEFENNLTDDDLHPYIVGSMLANGSISDNVLAIYTPHMEILERIKELLPKGDKLYTFIRPGCYGAFFRKEKQQGRKTNKTMSKFREYSLTGKKAKNKFIPKKYLYSSVENRLELLRGLMDGDGSSSCNQVRYTTISKQLAEDIMELIKSLGGRVTCNIHKNYSKDKYTRNERYDLQISMDINPFYCTYKASKFNPRQKNKYKFIKDIKKLPDEESQCIYVDSKDHLFVTDGYNLTHNTGIGTIFFMWCMLRHPEKSCFFVSHTSSMAKKVYSDIMNMLSDATRNIKAIFPEFEIKSNSAEDLWIQLESHSSNPYHTAYFRGIDGNMAGILEASWLLYCDDLIKNIEEAMNPTRLETARQKYSIDIAQRKTNKNVKELHIATRWSIHDVISTLEDLYSDNSMWRFIKRPAINNKGESNFMYKSPFEMDMEHWNRQRNLPDMDEISFNCIYQQEPIERDGLLFSEDNMAYFNGILPDIEPDMICSYCDIAWGGGDFLSMPIGYVYGNDVYIADVVYSNKTKLTTKPLVKGAILNHNIIKAGFEANNGGDEYAADISNQLKENNYKCAIQTFKAPTNKSKLARIIACVDEITAQGNSYRLIFLDKNARRDKPDYDLFMKHIFMFNQGAKYQGKQKDDCVDSLAGLVTNILESRVGAGTARSRISRASLGI